MEMAAIASSQAAPQGEGLEQVLNASRGQWTCLSANRSTKHLPDADGLQHTLFPGTKTQADPLRGPHQRPHVGLRPNGSGVTIEGVSPEPSQEKRPGKEGTE